MDLARHQLLARPLSPSIRTVNCVVATRVIRARSSFIERLCPIIMPGTPAFLV
jgi:hypothetical protein